MAGEGAQAQEEWGRCSLVTRCDNLEAGRAQADSPGAVLPHSTRPPNRRNDVQPLSVPDEPPADSRLLSSCSSSSWIRGSGSSPGSSGEFTSFYFGRTKAGRGDLASRWKGGTADLAFGGGG